MRRDLLSRVKQIGANFKTMLGALARRVLSPFGLELRRIEPPQTSYIGTQKTLHDANAAGLSLYDYVDQLWNEKGLVESNIDRFAKSGAFDAKGGNVVEIGPGTGRYLRHILERMSPARYDIYETANDWRAWLKETYPFITVCETDGRSLSQTEKANLVTSFGVFTYLPIVVALGYFREMIRVATPNSHVIFDLFSERSLADADAWLAAKRYESSFLSTGYVTDLFARENFSLVDSFLSKYGPGVSEFLVFKRK